jgi:glycosyltransferase involved in cell wall biosynthesis
MKVVIAGLYSGPSGIQAYTSELAEALSKAGHGVVVIDRSGRGPAPVPDRDRASPVVASLPPPRWRVRRALGALEGMRAHRSVRRVARDVDADVLHATHLDLAPRGGPPLVVNAYDPETRILRRALLARGRGQKPWPELLFAVSDRRACRRAAAVVPVSEDVRRALEAHHGRVEWIPPFLADERVHGSASPRSNDCVMVASTLDDRGKGLELAIEAVSWARSSVPDMRLVLVGGWADHARVSTLPAFCEVSGLVPRERVAERLRGAGCCLMPSRWEEFGYAGLEALAAGTPLVCGQLPGFANLRTEGVVIARKRSPEAFGGAICKALELQAFAFPDQFRASSAAARLVRLYETVIDEASRSGRA